MKQNVQMIILGTGEEKYQKFLKKAEKKYKTKLAVHLGFDETLAHKIEAAADMFLMPSKYEPCGLNQMYSLRYGTVPIARNTGGLSDTIIDYKKKNGNGFLFNKYDAKELMKVIKTALDLYKDSNKWNKIARQGMSLDFSWKVSAQKYMKLYKDVASS
jgi:starch synthase